MGSKIYLSIIMPVYNSGIYLKIAINSILSQCDNSMELILVDDGSTDGSSQLCDEYSNTDNRVIVIHQNNGGICSARNAALKIARGEYIGFADHDDEFLIGMYEHCKNIAMKHHPDMIKFGKRIDYIDINKKVYRSDVLSFKDDLIERDEITNRYLELRQNSLFRFVWDGWFKTSIIRDNDIVFDTYYKYGGEDHEFCNVFSRYTSSILTMSEVYYVHYMRQGFSTSSKKVDFLYYKEEAKRLNETLDIIKYPLKGNCALYLNQFFESIVLAITRYYLRIKASDKDIVREINLIDEEGLIKTMPEEITLYMLLKQSKKFGVFTYLYYKKKYSLMLTLCKLRYKLMK